MSFSVVVEPIGANKAPPAFANDAEEDAWFERQWATWLYDAPVAADGTWFEFWHLPAIRLHLPMLSGVYRKGLVISRQDELQALQAELDALEDAWQMLLRANASEQMARHTKLCERMGDVRDAIRIALEHGAQLSIS